MTCGQQQTINGETIRAKCILNVKHPGPHTDGDKQWADSDDSPMDSNYDLASKEASKPTPQPAWVHLAADEQAMHNRFMEKCKPFLPGVKVFTAFGAGEIVQVINVTDQYCPFEVKCSDGQTRMFKRECLSLNLANVPKLKCKGCDDVHSFDCPLALSKQPMTHVEAVIEGMKAEERQVRFVQITANSTALFGLDSTGQIWFNRDMVWYKVEPPVL